MSEKSIGDFKNDLKKKKNKNGDDDLISDSLATAICDEAIINRQKLEKQIDLMQNVWGHSNIGIEAKKAAMTMLSTKTGMYAKIPLRCKASKCPYKDSCYLLNYDLAPEGEPCPIETAQIELRYVNYSNDFNLDESSFTDRNLVSEIINCDIMLERCKSLIAKEEVPVIEVVAGIGENGEAFYRPEISKFQDAYDRTLRRRNELYSLMMATRKDNKLKDVESKSSIMDIISTIHDEGGFYEDKKPEHL